MCNFGGSVRENSPRRSAAPSSEEPQFDRTLVKGMRLLEILAESQQPRGITDLASATGLLKSNVHRILQTLVELRYVRREAETGRYSCTMRLWEYGELVADRLDVRSLARPLLEKLARDTLETVHLAILDGLDVIYIDKLDSPQQIPAYSRIGGRAPAHAVATGKALLAFAAPETLERLYNCDLQRFSKMTITSGKRLAAEFANIRKTGLALNSGEWREGVNGIAAPLLDHRNRAVAAIGVTCPGVRVSQASVKLLGPHVRSAAQEISALLGHNA
jgi:DNA-binding IclR family transcriptional regulator